MGTRGTLRPHITDAMNATQLEEELKLAIDRIREITEAAGRKRATTPNSTLSEREIRRLEEIEAKGEKYGWNG